MSNPEPPFGAVQNGREHMRRIRDFYSFRCGAGPLHNCQEFIELRECFEAMAQYIDEVGDGWEPSEVQQGLTPIPDRYDEA